MSIVNGQIELEKYLASLREVLPAGWRVYDVGGQIVFPVYENGFLTTKKEILLLNERGDNEPVFLPEDSYYDHGIFVVKVDELKLSIIRALARLGRAVVPKLGSGIGSRTCSGIQF